jgi:LCP family protein required for cell wall assembly
MRCIYDLKFIFMYNDNSLSIEEKKKFEEHLDSCERCSGILSQDKAVMDFFRKEENAESVKIQKDKLMQSIPFGKYSKNPMKFRILSMANRVIPSRSTLVKVAAVVVMLALILNYQAVFSGVADKAASILKQYGFENKETLSEKRPRLTKGNLAASSIVSEDSTNIMIIGEDDSNVYDTIGIVSIDEKRKQLKIIMLSRDIKVEYSSYVKNNVMLSTDISKRSILSNASFIGSEIGYKGRFQSSSISFLSDIIKEKLNIKVDHYVKLEYECLRQIVDLFGGVDIDVPYNMNYDDPIQNLSIHLDKGMQHLDGKKAECFLRYRPHKSENEASMDAIDRRNTNQADFIKALIQQKATTSNIDKLPQLFGIIDKTTEHSFDIKNDLASYIKYLKGLAADKYTIESTIINGFD